MNTITLQALQGSIEKWQQIVASTKAEDQGGRNCPLCDMFWVGCCRGCPVSEATGMSLCVGSPYAKWTTHMHSHSRSPSYHRHRGCKECLRLAEAELAFLVGLIPDKG